MGVWGEGVEKRREEKRRESGTRVSVYFCKFEAVVVGAGRVRFVRHERDIVDRGLLTLWIKCTLIISQVKTGILTIRLFRRPAFLWCCWFYYFSKYPRLQQLQRLGAGLVV